MPMRIRAGSGASGKRLLGSVPELRRDHLKLSNCRGREADVERTNGGTMKKIIRSIYAWSQSDIGDGLIGIALLLAIMALLMVVAPIIL
jgi:hypothetical protein